MKAILLRLLSLSAAGILFAALAAADPILQSSYFGGSDSDSINAIAVDPSSGDVLVAGHTYSANLPAVPTAAQPFNFGGVAGFVARLDASLRTLRAVTYLGGSGGEEILAVAIHPATGDVYVAGFTASADFPGTSRGAQPAYAGLGDGFVARLDGSLTRVLSASYFGGAYTDRITALAIDSRSGDVFVAGHTESTDLPGTAGGAQPGNAGGIDGFIARFDPTLGRLIQATYFGGGAWDTIEALTIHPRSGEVLIGGQTLGSDLPATEGGANLGQPGNGNWDAFVARIDPTLTRFLQTTYLGGSGAEDVTAIAVAPSTGEILAAGWTTYVDFPATAGGAQPQPGGLWDPAANEQKKADGFIARFDPSLAELRQATYLGGGGDDYVRALAVDPDSGDVLAAGETYSDDLPGAAHAVQPAAGGAGDGFVARLDPTLTHLTRATYMGGTNTDAVLSLAIDPVTHQVLVGGTTGSLDLPGAAGGFQSSHAGGSEFFGGDGFVSRLTRGLADATIECVPDGGMLCLADGRFRVQVAVHEYPGSPLGGGKAVALSSDTGYFWFFDPGNVELVVKVLDGRTLNGNFWVFYGALSNLDYEIAVTDTDTGRVRRYANAAGTLASVADTQAFSGEPAAASTGSIRAVPSAPASACGGAGASLCLSQTRFRVEVDWAVPDRGTSGQGVPVALTGDTGYFWFFDPGNVELVVKVLDGRSVNGHFWVFYGALSNVQYTIRVTDSQTGDVRTYENPAGTLASAADTSAF